MPDTKVTFDRKPEMSMMNMYSTIHGYAQDAEAYLDTWLKTVLQTELGWTDVWGITNEEIAARVKKEEITLNATCLPTHGFGTTHQLRRKGKYIATLSLGLSVTKESADSPPRQFDGTPIAFDYRNALSQEK